MSETTPDSDPRSDEARIADDIGQPGETPPGPDRSTDGNDDAEAEAEGEASEEPDGGTDPT